MAEKKKILKKDFTAFLLSNKDRKERQRKKIPESQRIYQDLIEFETVNTI